MPKMNSKPARTMPSPLRGTAANQSSKLPQISNLEEVVDCQSNETGDIAETVNAPDPFDPASLRLAPEVDSAGFTITKKLINVKCDKPGKQDWVRTHPGEDCRLDAAILDDPSSIGEKYLVAPCLFSELNRFVKPCRIMLAVTRHGKPFLWPATITNPDARPLPCHVSMLDAQTTAIHRWTQVCWSPSKSDYDVEYATGDLGVPCWPEESFRDILELAFTGHLITSMDHPFVQQLLGKV